MPFYVQLSLLGIAVALVMLVLTFSMKRAGLFDVDALVKRQVDRDLAAVRLPTPAGYGAGRNAVIPWGPVVGQPLAAAAVLTVFLATGVPTRFGCDTETAAPVASLPTLVG